jgi:SAM-dependent methyltransferase
MVILNLGCGTKTSEFPAVINIDWSIYLRLKKSYLADLLVPLLLSGERLQRYRELPRNILVCDISKGLPFADNSVDAVYHSHMLEHLDRSVVDKFLFEVNRVLRPGGIHRIVVPDLELLCKNYFKSLANTKNEAEHDASVAEMFEQCVRRESYGTSR